MRLFTLLQSSDEDLCKWMRCSKPSAHDYHPLFGFYKKHKRLSFDGTLLSTAHLVIEGRGEGSEGAGGMNRLHSHLRKSDFDVSYHSHPERIPLNHSFHSSSQRSLQSLCGNGEFSPQ